jgi:hypothetical protein
MAIDPALLAKLKKSKNKFARSGNTLKLKEGKTVVRLLQKGNEDFWREIGIHWIKTEEDGPPVAVTGCSEEVYGKPCAICAAIEIAKKGATDEELEIIKKWRAKSSVLVTALIRSGPDASADPQILELSGTTWNKIAGTIEEYQLQDIDIMSPSDGVDFIIERVGRGLNTEYNVMTMPKSKPVPPDVYDRLPDLDAHIERELFRGDEPKALRAIGDFSGTDVSSSARLTGPKTTTARLTSSVVDDAVIEDDPEIAELRAEVKLPEPEPEPEVVESDEDREIREMEERMAALKAKKAKEAKTKAAAASVVSKKAAKVETVASPATAPVATETDDEVERMLAELDGAD